MTHSDFYQYSWELFRHQRTISKPRLVRVFVLGFSLILFAAIFKLLNDLLSFSSYEFFWLMFCFALIFVTIIGVFWEQIESELHHVNVNVYQISQDGIEVNQKHFDFDQLNISQALKAVEKAKADTGPAGMRISLHRKRGGTVELEFEDTTTKTRVLKALTHYLS